MLSLILKIIKSLNDILPEIQNLNSLKSIFNNFTVTFEPMRKEIIIESDKVKITIETTDDITYSELWNLYQIIQSLSKSKP